MVYLRTMGDRGVADRVEIEGLTGFGNTGQRRKAFDGAEMKSCVLLLFWLWLRCWRERV